MTKPFQFPRNETKSYNNLRSIYASKTAELQVRIVRICDVLAWACSITRSLWLSDTEVLNFRTVRTSTFSAVVNGGSLNLEQRTVATPNSVFGESDNLRGRSEEGQWHC